MYILTSVSRSQPFALFFIVTYRLPITPPQLTANGPAELPLLTAKPQGTAVALDVSPSLMPAKTWNSPRKLV